VAVQAPKMIPSEGYGSLCCWAQFEARILGVIKWVSVIIFILLFAIGALEGGHRSSSIQHRCSHSLLSAYHCTKCWLW
jgi:hypothetical protein